MAAFVRSEGADRPASGLLRAGPSDSSTALLPVLDRSSAWHRDPCLIAANPRFTYHINGFDLASDFQDVVPASVASTP